MGVVVPEGVNAPVIAPVLASKSGLSLTGDEVGALSALAADSDAVPAMVDLRSAPEAENLREEPAVLGNPNPLAAMYLDATKSTLMPFVQPEV